ncbi:LPS export ABC transporter ATP-binding protein [Polluticaenibacter yanchengensis]|uniref:LPS export ABC transporter ATP-binding protein n=1 Tax=Polluticaenibacter yanchengensis TaxID=3014562 RepID=UPI00387AD52B
MSLTIHTSNLIKTYSGRTVVKKVSVNVSQGEIVGLLGPNGAGKTTTFYMVVGLIRPDEGDVFLNDTNITKLPMYKRAQMGIGYLPQEASVFRKLSVYNNIMAVLEMTRLTKKERIMKAESLLDEFHLQHVRNNNGDSLSGGERRRTEIARALAVDPKFILLDEPFAGVDPIAVEDIQTVVARLKYKNIGILITDHNVNETLSVCDRAYLLIDGNIFKQGTAQELADDEQVRRLYLGTNFELRRKDWIINMEKEQSLRKSAIPGVELLQSLVQRLEIELKDKELVLPESVAEVVQVCNDLASLRGDDDFAKMAQILISTPIDEVPGLIPDLNELIRQKIK